MHPELINSIAEIKKASAITNYEIGLLEKRVADAIVAACEEIAAGKLHEAFIVDPIQGGAGTSLNMNANEVIANRGNQIAGKKLLHPNDDINMSQSSNDTFPTALSDHREYEAALQDHFLEYMKQDPKVNPKIAGSVMEAIYSYHREYEAQAANIYTDTRFALNACCCVLAVLLTNPIF